ncbi:glycoside hydrolase family 25 protein [Pseudobutyrivibrio sp. MD2005]|uniref:glycoside hydrolase family 25 protein n=1 Tax=Pseudobutyrivibrio sp. MD2005 TaxID=1410616 RepID=UPI000A69F3D6|nr:glycoside hydrolase family 25 protein [Pseudobutyrivibrio sp. MD2005]
MKGSVKIIFLLAALTLMSCGAKKDDLGSDALVEEANVAEAEEEKSEESLVFRDVFGEEYETIINPDVPANEYDSKAFSFDGQKVKFADSDYMLGVDVSHHQGDIDWNKVKEAGFDFAILRIGYRGYGQTGSLNADKMFETYYTQAREAGLQVGVYFFAQAINEDEAKEEAEFVLNILDGRELDLPVVYDPESILDDEARTDNVTGEQFTKNTKVFCEKISENGYQPMIYANMLWEAFELDLSQLTEYPVWYADYEPVPQTPYNFQCWQYSNTSTVDGIEGEVDLDIWIYTSDGKNHH